MIGSRKAARRLLSTLGLATLAVLAFGVLTAGAAQAATWHINGKSLEEVGITYEPFVASGTFDVEIPGFNFDISCAEEASGTIRQGGAVEEDVALSGCYMQGAPRCQVAPASMQLSGTGAQLHNRVGVVMVSFTVTKCAAADTWEFYEPPSGLSLQLGPESAALAVGTSGEGGWGAEPADFSGSSTWRLTGANSGQSFGYW